MNLVNLMQLCEFAAFVEGLYRLFPFVCLIEAACCDVFGKFINIFAYFLTYIAYVKLISYFRWLHWMALISYSKNTASLCYLKQHRNYLLTFTSIGSFSFFSLWKYEMTTLMLINWLACSYCPILIDILSHCWFLCSYCTYLVRWHVLFA